MTSKSDPVAFAEMSEDEWIAAASELEHLEQQRGWDVWVAIIESFRQSMLEQMVGESRAEELHMLRGAAMAAAAIRDRIPLITERARVILAEKQELERNLPPARDPRERIAIVSSVDVISE
jgi:hypothetical protein